MINLRLFHAEASRNEIGLLSYGLQFIWRSHEFNSIDEAVVGMQIIIKYCRWLTCSDVLVGVFGAAQSSFERLNFRFHVTAQGNPIESLFTLNQICW